MLAKFGETSTRLFEKYMPNAFVFAMLLTNITGLIALIWLGAKPIDIVTGWYDGFYSLIEE
tara:strand:- start:30435 stop:30617 length:183 start_codon:yes stop_codon:yes gene_type:complete